MSDQFLNFPTNRPQPDLFVTIAQAYFGTTTPLTNLANEVFVKANVGGDRRSLDQALDGLVFSENGGQPANA